MITKDQIDFFSRKFKTNESTVFREYLQLVFLNKLYKREESNQIFFKGGTAIHFLWNAPRFSEDLDFIVEVVEKKFLSFINSVFAEIAKEEEITVKEKKTITGKRFLLTAIPGVLRYATFINLDFSFREKVLRPERSILETPYPIVFTSFVYHLSGEEICAEKIRALLTRQKGRDFFDLWFLLSKGVSIDNDLITRKLHYYQISERQFNSLLQKLEKFPEKEFIVDMRPFVPIGERNRLKERFNYIKTYLLNKLSNTIELLHNKKF